jgi:membrane-associated PAP2 superfamily phosphatase
MSVNKENYYFLKQHFLWPSLIFVVVAYVFELHQLDLIVADWFYTLEGHQWSLKNHYLMKIVLHDKAQNISKLLGLLFLVLAISSHFYQRLSPYKKGLWLLFISFAVSAALVAIGKSISHVDCPWDLQRYGGTRPYLPIFDAHPGNYKFGRCFPSGHASGGYGLIGLYFFFSTTNQNGNGWV